MEFSTETASVLHPYDRFLTVKPPDTASSNDLSTLAPNRADNGVSMVVTQLDESGPDQICPQADLDLTAVN